MSVSNRVTVSIQVTETSTQDAGTPVLKHLFKLLGFDKPDFKIYADGSGDNQQNLVYSDEVPLSGSAASLDLNGGITSKLTGAAQVYSKIKGIAIANLSTTTGDAFTVGGGADAVIGAQMPVGPGGIFLYTDPIDGTAVTGGSVDTLQIDPGADTFDIAFVIWGT
jgi:hypothetical protein